MAEDLTLLAYLVPKLTSRSEDTATDALAFILNKSAACRAALDSFLKDADFNLEPIARVETQVTYQDGSRPDMVGYDRSGAKRLLVESKFWATLQEGQASGYFRQLQEPGALLFIAPDSRIDTLWAEIRRQMESGEQSVRLEEVEAENRARRSKVVGTDKRLMLISWDLLLGTLAVATADDARIASDIQQLRGLARHQDEEAFQPIRPEEVGLVLPRRIRGLNRLIDDLVDARGVPGGWMTTAGLRATPQREGYGRYFRFVDASSGNTIQGDLFVCVNYHRWANSAETPLWLWIGPGVPIGIGKLRDVVPSLVETAGSGTDMPIFLRTGVEYENVLNDVVGQVRTVLDMIDNP